MTMMMMMTTMTTITTTMMMMMMMMMMMIMMIFKTRKLSHQGVFHRGPGKLLSGTWNVSVQFRMCDKQVKLHFGPVWPTQTKLNTESVAKNNKE